jgi:hypothetical protein
MTLSVPRAIAVSCALILGCGKTLGEGGQTIADASVLVDGATCVDLKTTSDDLSCESDSDCTRAITGLICETGCTCPGEGVPVNHSAAERLGSELVGAHLPSQQGCSSGCPGAGTLQCVGGQCTDCGPFPPFAPGCTTDAGGRDAAGDTGVTDHDAAPTCVEISTAAYDTSCQSSSDCILIQTGRVCDGDCACGGAPVSASEQGAYDDALRGITIGGCPCPETTRPVCWEDHCILPVVLPAPDAGG